MTEETQVTKKKILYYLEKINKLEVNRSEVKEIQRSICDKLEVLVYPMNNIILRIEDNQQKIVQHWKKYGDNYNSIPVLHSDVPSYTNSFKEFVSMILKERDILIDGIVSLFKIADKQKIIVNPEKTKK